MMRQFLEIELEDAKDKLIGALAADTPRLQGGARALRMLLAMLTNNYPDITAKTES
jgi:hypothetical protein